MTHAKGRSGENEVCRFLREAGIAIERNLEERRSGNAGDVLTDLPLTIEVKSQKQPSVYRALDKHEKPPTPEATRSPSSSESAAGESPPTDWSR